MGYKRIILSERILIQQLLSHNLSYSEIGSELDRNKSSICRAVKPFGRIKYAALKAHWYAQKNTGFGKLCYCKLKCFSLLLKYPCERLIAIKHKFFSL